MPPTKTTAPKSPKSLPGPGSLPPLTKAERAVIRQLAESPSFRVTHAAVHAGVLTEDNALRIARAVRGRTAEQMTTGYQSERLEVGTDTATAVLTSLAVVLEVPVPTWTAWLGQIRRPLRGVSTVIRQWTATWMFLEREAWTPGRIAQAADLLSAVAPRIPAAVAQGIAREWEAGAGPSAKRLAADLPPAVFDAIRQGAAYDTRVRPIRDVAAEVAPLANSADIMRLTRQGNWTARPVAERCGILRRCRFDGASADVQSALRELICVVLLPDDEALVPALRALVRAQGTVAARAAVVAWLLELSNTEEPLRRDLVLLTFCAEEMVRAPAAARPEALVTLVLNGWQILPPGLWSRAVAQIVRQQKRNTTADNYDEVRSALRNWWVACEDPGHHVDPTLATECLASPDRALNAWALLHLVPRVAEVLGDVPSKVPLEVRTRILPSHQTR